MARSRTKLKKQNVFDDFIAAAEFLIKENTRRRANWPSTVLKRWLAGRRLFQPATGLFRAVVEQPG